MRTSRGFQGPVPVDLEPSLLPAPDLAIMMDPARAAGLPVTKMKRLKGPVQPGRIGAALDLNHGGAFTRRLTLICPQS